MYVVEDTKGYAMILVNDNHANTSIMVCAFT